VKAGVLSERLTRFFYIYLTKYVLCVVASRHRSLAGVYEMKAKLCRRKNLAPFCKSLKNATKMHGAPEQRKLRKWFAVFRAKGGAAVAMSGKRASAPDAMTQPTTRPPSCSAPSHPGGRAFLADAIADGEFSDGPIVRLSDEHAVCFDAAARVAAPPLLRRWMDADPV
jgi:hypothetical protein